MTRVRLTDVAARAGVSMKTVSNVVHHHPHVSPAMRARVQEAIDELGYRPNLTARRLATGRTGMIALAMPEIDHPYFSELSRSIAEVAAEMGYRVLIEQTLGEAEAERAVIMDREAGLVDGVIFHPVSMTTVEIGKLRRDLPLVLLGESARPLTTDHVMIDNVQAARDGTELLRRTALSAYARQDVAALHGPDWLAFLDQAYGGTGFSNGPGKAVAEAPYKKACNGGDLKPLIRTWIKTHKGMVV